MELGDYCEIAAEVLGTTREQIARLPGIGLADSALAAPAAGLGDEDAYPSLIEKAAVLVERLARNHPLPDGNKRAAFLSVWLFMCGGPHRVAERLRRRSRSRGHGLGGVPRYVPGRVAVT